MAVHPPTGPFPPNDGSNIFRRGMPKPTAKPGSADDARTPAPPEPAEPLDLDDEDALFGSPAQAQPVDQLDAELSGIMLDDAPDDQPVSAILLDDPTPSDGPPSGDLLDDALAPARPPAPPSAADSSIFTGPPPAAGVGSGWLDPSASADRAADSQSGNLWSDPLPKDLPLPADPPSTSKFADAADLFAELRGDTPASDSVWVEAADAAAGATGRVSESEVRRALDTTRPASMADIDLGEADDAELVGGKGDATEFDSHLADADEGSIFDRPVPADTEIISPADDIDFNLPVADPHAGSSMSERHTGLADADPEAVAADLFGPADAGQSVAMDPADATDDRAPAIAAAVAAGALGGVGAAAPRGKGEPAAKGRASSKVTSPPRVRAVVDGEDRPEPKGKKRGGIGGVLAGLATGLALGVGGFAVVYMTGLIPNQTKTAVANGAGGDRPVDGTVRQLDDALQKANEKAEQAAADLKQAKDGLTRRQAALDDATDKLRTAEDDLKAAKKDASDAKAAVEPFRKEAETAKKEAADAKKLAAAADGLQKDLDAAKKEATDAKKDLDGVKKLAADTAKERDEAKTTLTTATKDAEAKAKLAADATAKLVDTEKKLKTADDAVAGALTELKANKLLDEKDDITKLSDAVKKLAAVATSGDAKKAAEALVVAQKERDIAKAALTKAEADAKAATDAAAKAKADADKLVADTMKAADDKAKTAVDDATKGLKKQLADAAAATKKAQDDLTTAKATAKADAEAAAKAKLDEATAKATAAEKALDTKVKAMEADFAAKLAEARAGVVKVVPAEMEAVEKAARSYADGVAAYRGGRYTAAETAFAAATVSQPADARYWYYLGLARARTGTAGADDAFKKGAEMEGRNKPIAREIDTALERLSFADKERVNKYRQ